MEKQLRSGFTTGTCATAAAKAAAVFLLTGGAPDYVRILMGNGEEAEFSPEYFMEGGSWCRVQKDGGDDPDVTDKAWVYAGVFPVGDQEWEELCSSQKGYVLDEYPGLYLNGGPGIGVATRQGLSCPVGHYAINPVPRMRILEAVDLVRREAAYEGRLEVCVAIPEGIWLAEKTFNPRLGIQGGISILGTTGIVKPMSEEALVETIRLDIRMKAAAGESVLLLTPGNYGEAFLQQEMEIGLGEAVKCSNFIGASVEMAVQEGFTQILLVGHIGKLVKVAGGARNTHSKYGDGRMEAMESLAREAERKLGIGEEGRESDIEEESCESGIAKENSGSGVLEKIRSSNTTEEAVGWLKKAGLAETVLGCAAERVKEQIALWAGPGAEAEAVVFSSAHRIMGQSSGAGRLLRLRKGRV